MFPNEATALTDTDTDADLAGTGDPSAWLRRGLVGCAVSLVPIDSLRGGLTPRADLVNLEHARVLAGVGRQLPPIVVHEPSGQVIDGVHRVRAALLRGQSHIRARMYNGSYEDAFVIAVKLNIAHGLPLSRAERSAAVEQILRTHPQWSNRMVADVAGLSESTVRSVRRLVIQADGQPMHRIGRDGRIRPVDAAEGRQRISGLLAENPTASAREIARKAGVSANTVLNVRRALGAAVRAPSSPDGPEEELEAMLAKLMTDPSLRHSERGRLLLRWMSLSRELLNSRSELADAVPEHWSDSAARLARAYADLWGDVASRLERRSAPAT